MRNIRVRGAHIAGQQQCMHYSNRINFIESKMCVQVATLQLRAIASAGYRLYGAYSLHTDNKNKIFVFFFTHNAHTATCTRFLFERAE